VKLDEVCEVVRGSSPRPKSDPRFYGGSVPRLMVADLTRDGKLVSARIDSLTELGAKQSRPMYQGDVVIAVSGAPGLPAILAHDACIHDGFVGLRNLDQKRINADFLYAYLTFARATSNGKAVGAIFKNLTTDQIKDLEVPDLPVAEQRRIAEVLDRAETLRTKRRAVLAQLDILTQSLFLDLFGDPRTNEKGWSKCQIGSIISDMRGGAALEPDDFVESGFPILHKGAIKPDGGISIDPKKKTFAPLEFANANRRCQVTREFTAVTLRDLVPSGPSIGLAVDLHNGPFDEYLLAQGAYAFRLDSAKAVPEYFVHLSNIPNFRHVLRQNAVGSTQIHIRTPIYLAIPIPLPPIELQREFAHRVRAVEELKTVQRASRAELDALFASLQTRAFKGEL
jgi:type I restriction enzyme, S subunit